MSKEEILKDKIVNRDGTESTVTVQSLMAYRELKDSGRLNAEQQFVYMKLYRHGPSTGQELYRAVIAEEISDFFENETARSIENKRGERTLKQYIKDELLPGSTMLKGVERIRKRLPELEEQGLVQRRTKRKCDVTGKTATEWWVNNDAEV